MQVGAVNSDPYYQENMVISDLPAGLYDVTISYAAVYYYLTFEIYPGRVTYFHIPTAGMVSIWSCLMIQMMILYFQVSG